jgi:hypothetical protein
MATIKIYCTSASGNNIELMNAGEVEDGEMPIYFECDEHADERLAFHLSKEDAREVILYLKKQFAINP